MPVLIIRLKVSDFAAWKPSFDAQESTRRAHGCQLARLFRGVSAPNEVLIFLDWDSLERARLFARSDDLREQLKLADVIDDPDLWFLEETNRAPL